MSDIKRIAETAKQYKESTFLQFRSLGQGDYGIEGRWRDGHCKLLVLGLPSYERAVEFAEFLSVTDPTLPYPVKEVDEHRNVRAYMYEQYGVADSNYHCNLPSVVAFDGYFVVALTRTFTDVSALPKIDL